MSPKSILLGTTFVLMISTAFAQTSKEEVIERLKEDGFSRIEISPTLFGNTRIEGKGDGVEREIVLGKDGTVMRDRLERDSVTTIANNNSDLENDKNNDGRSSGGSNDNGGGKAGASSSEGGDGAAGESEGEQEGNSDGDSNNDSDGGGNRGSDGASVGDSNGKSGGDSDGDSEGNGG
ncbi:MAG: hypothetical protein ABJI96_05195 [Paracoccaceae bacterium]